MDPIQQPYLLSLFSHIWFATPQEVLQADWQEVWHSPHPPVLADFSRSRDTKVLILFTWNSTFLIVFYNTIVFNIAMVSHFVRIVK